MMLAESAAAAVPPIPASLHRQAMAAGVVFERFNDDANRGWRVCFNGCSRELENAIDRALMGGAA